MRDVSLYTDSDDNMQLKLGSLSIPIQNTQQEGERYTLDLLLLLLYQCGTLALTSLISTYDAFAGNHCLERSKITMSSCTLKTLESLEI